MKSKGENKFFKLSLFPWILKYDTDVKKSYSEFKKWLDR